MSEEINFNVGDWVVFKKLTAQHGIPSGWNIELPLLVVMNLRQTPKLYKKRAGDIEKYKNGIVLQHTKYYNSRNNLHASWYAEPEDCELCEDIKLIEKSKKLLNL